MDEEIRKSMVIDEINSIIYQIRKYNPSETAFTLVGENILSMSLPDLLEVRSQLQRTLRTLGGANRD